jgi:predicted Zn finger-like uncharacterized protein
MTYRTTCSHCASVFRLGADQLDAAAGWVQCSVCGRAFDARASLLMEDGSPLPPPPPAPVARDEPVDDAVPPDADVVEIADDRVADSAPAEPPDAEPDADAIREPDATPQGILQREAPDDDLPSIILIDPDLAVSDDPGPLPQFQVPVYPPPPAVAAASSAPAAAVSRAAPSARVEYATTAAGPQRRASSHPVKSWVWIVASLVLFLALLAQTSYHLRDTLVSRLPQTRPAFDQACALLGCTLSLPKNLELLQIVGSDLQTEASGRLKLTLTLGNRASHVQAWPVLVLTLTDQLNRPLARRSFAPSEYLDDARRIAIGIPPRSEQPLDLPLNVRNLAPMGFDLKLTY